jgi:SAM-dependent methyltransferase
MSADHTLLLLGLAAGGRVLEASADRGERARALIDGGLHPTCLRATAAEAEALGALGFNAVSLDRATGLAAFDAALIAAALGRTRGSEWVTADLGALVAQVAGMLRPGASLVLSLPNPLHGFPGVAALIRRLQPRPHAPPAPPRGPLRLRLVSRAALCRTLDRAGLTAVQVFAALPSGVAPKFLVPLGDRAVLAHFLRHLVPRPRRAARRTAVALAVALGPALLERLLPAYAVSARRQDAR